jgi:hypothetical protein
VSDGRPISFTSSSFVRLLGSRRFCGLRSARGLGVVSEVRLPWLVEGVGLASRRMCRASTGDLPTSSVCLDAGESACTGAKACVVSAAGMLVEAPPRRGRRWWERDAIGLVDPASPASSRRVGRRRQAFGEVAPRRTQADSSAAAVAAKSRWIPRSRVCRPSRCKADDPPRFCVLTR